LNLKRLQEKSALTANVNLLLLDNGSAGDLTREAAEKALAGTWRLEHAGIKIREFSGLGVVQLVSERVFLDPLTAKAALKMKEKMGDQVVGSLTYLANSISSDDGGSTPYSFMTACSPSANRILSPVPSDMKD